MDTNSPSLQPYFETFGQSDGPHAAAIHDAAARELDRLLRVEVGAPGRGMLLKAPRAGYGKTHLIDRLRRAMASTHEFLPLRPQDGRHVDPSAALEDALRRLSRSLPASGGLTSLDILARHLFSLGLRPLVTSGEVPCQDREAAASALEQRPVETFDFHHSQAITAHWTRENFEVLGPRLSLELSRLTGCALGPVAFWVAAFFRYAVVSPEHPGRAGTLIHSAGSEADAERFGTLLALISLVRRVVVVVDDLEGVHDDPEGARRIAGFLAVVRQEAPRVDIIVSVNRDIWESAFVPALSGGLLDRLSEQVVALDSLDRAQMISLLESRGVKGAEKILEAIPLAPEDRYPRRVLKVVAEFLESSGSATPKSDRDPGEFA